MKSYTDLEQSKKLAEILPIESADMEYMFLKEDNSKVSNIPFVKDDDEPEWPTDSAYDFIPSWSLSALLDVLPYPILYQQSDGTWALDVWVEQVKPYSVTNAICRIDACYEMIIKLHESNLL